MKLKIIYKDKALKITLKPEKTIEDLKKKIQFIGKECFQRIRIRKEYIVLHYNNEILQNDKKLKEYELQDGSEINMRINVAFSIGDARESKKNTFEMNYNDTAEDMIKKISESMKLLAVQIRYRNKELKDKYLRKYLKKSGITFKVIINGKHVTEKSHNSNVVTPLPTPSNEKNNVNKEKKDGKSNKEYISLKVIKELEGASDIIETCIEVPLQCSIEKLYKIIGDKLQIGLCSIDIWYLDIILTDGFIEKYGIKANGNLTVRTKTINKRRTDGQFVVKVKNMTNKSAGENIQKFLVDEFQTVEALKRILQEQHNVNAKYIKLLFEEKELKNEDIIQQLDIENETTFTMQIMKLENKENIEVNIKVWNSLCSSGDKDHENMSVRTDEKVELLRQKISKIFKLSSLDYVLSLSGEILKANNVLDTYDIKQGDEIVISNSLLVRYFMGGDQFSARVIRFPFRPEENVSDLKSKITKKLNIAAPFIHLHLDGETLEDEVLLGEAGIENESYLMMMATLAGGF